MHLINNEVTKIGQLKNRNMNILNPKITRKLSFLLSGLFAFVFSFAQETKKLDIDINTKGNDNNFFMQPWVWVIGGAVFILLLVALLKSGKSK